MELEQTKIKKIITTIDNDKSYSIDVDETTTFYDFKKILSAAAHLLKNCFRIYHQDQELTNDYDDNTIQQIFPDLDPVPLKIISNKDVYEYEDELISVKFNINVPCQIHAGKYKMLYCFSCNKSICMDCFNADHKNHKVEEKADYLAPARLLMNNIFSNSTLYRADSRLSKYMECVNFRSNLKLNIFDNLRKMINELEIKFSSCLEYFSTSEDLTEKNTNENLELLKKYCIECFIKLKNDINTKGIIIDDEIFLTLYHKLKEIEKYKTDYFEENKQKYEKINTLLAPFIEQVEKISNELKFTFDTLLNKELYENFKNVVQENIVEKVDKETVNDFMFSNLAVPRKSLNKSSFSTYASHKKKSKTSSSPDKLNKKEEKSPFNKVNFSAQRNSDNSGNIFSRGTFSNSKNEQSSSQNKALTYQKTEEQKFRGKGLNIIEGKIGMNNSNMMNNSKTTNTNINVSEFNNRNITSTTTNIINGTNNVYLAGMISNNTSNNNISNLNDQQKIKEQTTLYNNTSTTYPILSQGQTNIFSSQLDHSQGPLMNSSQSHHIISKEITSTTTIVNNNTQQQISSSTSNNNNMFSGKLIDVLSNEIGKKEAQYNMDNKTEKFVESEKEHKGQFSFMYPIFNSNGIQGAYSDDTNGRASVDFSQALTENDPQIRAFPQGGSFCNFEKFMYFTGGKETQKGVGKIFLRISINPDKDKIAKVIKMPFMLNSHWNHSMIANENYVFVIGGYNSNKCEAFNMQTLKWESMPNLNSPERQRSMLIIHEDYLYAFMGYNQMGVMDSVERINISKMGNNKWEIVSVINTNNINLKFYGAGIYKANDKLYFIGGKYGLGDEDSDYKGDIYCFKFDRMEFILMEIYYQGNLHFIENQFHHCSTDTIGNFVDMNDGLLATMPVSALEKTE